MSGMYCCEYASMGAVCECATVVVDKDLGGPADLVVHGGKENWCVNSDRLSQHDFDCIYCKRQCCWCFGSGCYDDSQQPAGKGICCDCHIEKGCEP